MAYIKRPTSEQKRAWAEQKQRNKEEAFAMIRDVAEKYKKNPLHITELLAFASKFYNYSLNNIELIYAQNPNAVFVQSFKAWKDMNASVVKNVIRVIFFGVACRAPASLF